MSNGDFVKSSWHYDGNDFGRPIIAPSLDAQNGSYDHLLKQAILKNHTDNTIASAGAGLYLATVLRVESDGRIGTRTIEQDNWADLFYGNPEYVKLQNNNSGHAGMPPPPKLIKVRARVYGMHDGYPIPDSVEDAEAIDHYPIFTAISDIMTNLYGVPQPGELIWVGFLNTSNQSMGYWTARVNSRTNFSTISSGESSAAAAHNNPSLSPTAVSEYSSAAPPTATGADSGIMNKIASASKSPSALWGSSSGHGSIKSFDKFLKFLKKNPKMGTAGKHGKKYVVQRNAFDVPETSSEKSKLGIYYGPSDPRQNAAYVFVLNCIKTGAVMSLIESYLRSIGKTGVEVSPAGAASGIRLKKRIDLRDTPTDFLVGQHAWGVAVDFKIKDNRITYAGKDIYAIIYRLISEGILPGNNPNCAGLGYYLRTSADRQGRITLSTDDAVHYDWRGDNQGASAMVPRYVSKKGSTFSRWVWVCLRGAALAQGPESITEKFKNERNVNHCTKGLSDVQVSLSRENFVNAYNNTGEPKKGKPARVGDEVHIVYKSGIVYKIWAEDWRAWGEYFKNPLMAPALSGGTTYGDLYPSARGKGVPTLREWEQIFLGQSLQKKGSIFDKVFNDDMKKLVTDNLFEGDEASFFQSFDTINKISKGQSVAHLAEGQGPTQ